MLPCVVNYLLNSRQPLQYSPLKKLLSQQPGNYPSVKAVSEQAAPQVLPLLGLILPYCRRNTCPSVIFLEPHGHLSEACRWGAELS